MEEDSVLETDEHPMSEGMYNQLCQVRGFQKLNGSTYKAYVKAWTDRRGGGQVASKSG